MVDPILRRIRLFGPFDGTAASEVIAQLLFLHKRDQLEPITLEIDSPGGSLTGSLGILGAMRQVTCPVHTLCRVQCSGTALLLFSHGTKGQRVANPEAVFILYRTRGVAPAGNPAQSAELLKQFHQRIVKEFSEATGLPLSQIEEMMNAGKPLTAAQAQRMGFLDVIEGGSSRDNDSQRLPQDV